MTNTINTRTPDEIKKALQCRVKGCLEKCDHRCDMCELYVPNYYLEDRYADAHAYILQLEDRNEKLENAWRNLANSSSNARDAANKVIEHLESRLAQVERERDAMKHDFMIDGCEACKHGHSALDDCKAPWSPCKWEWRGICSENTKESSE